jgi:hypothetical protein
MLSVTESKGEMVSLSYPIPYALASLAVLLLMSCTPTHPITEAVCVSQCLDSLDHERVLIWSNDREVEPLLLGWVREHDAQVIEPVVVQDAIVRHHLVLEPEPGLEDVLRHLGNQVGADRVLIATVRRQSHVLNRMYSGYKEGYPWRYSTLFDLAVTVRSLGVNRPTIYWSVTATGTSPTFIADPSATELLTQTALRRASCEADPETQWTDDTGCVRKH